jgi:hypothetical protein
MSEVAKLSEKDMKAHEKDEVCGNTKNLMRKDCSLRKVETYTAGRNRRDSSTTG